MNACLIAVCAWSWNTRLYLAKCPGLDCTSPVNLVSAGSASVHRKRSIVHPFVPCKMPIFLHTSKNWKAGERKSCQMEFRYAHNIAKLHRVPGNPLSVWVFFFALFIQRVVINDVFDLTFIAIFSNSIRNFLQGFFPSRRSD